MILAGVYQVYPRDVEEVLYEHPQVKEVAVVGVQPPRWPFQRVKAYKEETLCLKSSSSALT